MSSIPAYGMMLAVTGIISVLFLAGAGLVTFALISRRSVPSGLASGAQSRGPSIPLIIGIVLLLAGLAGCAYSSYLMLAAQS